MGSTADIDTGEVTRNSFNLTINIGHPALNLMSEQVGLKEILISNLQNGVFGENENHIPGKSTGD
jgi:hypothetical protein